MTPSRRDKSPDQRRFDWPAFLVMRKQARQSASTANLYGDALNTRNRLAASLRRPITHRLRSAYRFGSGRSVRPAISKSMALPNRSHYFHHSIASHSRANRQYFRAIPASAKSLATLQIVQSAQSLLHAFRLNSEPMVLHPMWMLTGETPYPYLRQ